MLSQQLSRRIDALERPDGQQTIERKIQIRTVLQELRDLGQCPVGTVPKTPDSLFPCLLYYSKVILWLEKF